MAAIVDHLAHSDGECDDNDKRDKYKYEDDDNSFRKLVANANSTELPDTSDNYGMDEPVAPHTNAPIKVLNVAPTSTTNEEISFLTKGTEMPGSVRPSFGNQQWQPPPNQSPSGRGVSFPDTAGDDDNASLGNTVASSTFGEDRQKVVDQVILDPYGDKGTYTGIILRSTGM